MDMVEEERGQYRIAYHADCEKVPYRSSQGMGAD